ncbi:MAG: restriction endonuclease subunit S [bacterium]
MKQAQAQLRTYRQAVLKYAFEGKLTAAWREQHKPEPAEKLLTQIKVEREKQFQQQHVEWQKAGVDNNGKKKPPKPQKSKEFPPLTEAELAELPELPECWRWVRLEDISNKITDGEHIRPKTTPGGVYFLSAKDIRENGVSFDDPLFVSKNDAEKYQKRCDPARGDILIVSRGATVGRMCIVNTVETFCLLGSVILLKVDTGLESKYLTYILKSPSMQKALLVISGSTAQQTIYLRDIKQLIIPICTLPEQHQIVQEIESRLSVCDKLEESIKRACKKPRRCGRAF